MLILKKKLNQTLYLKELAEQIMPKVSRRKDITKTEAKINDIENRKTIEKIKNTKTFFQNDKIDKLLGRLTNKKRRLK